MSSVIEAVRTRRTIRKYEDREVPAEVLATLMESVEEAQSWANTQCWEVVVVRDPALRAAIQKSLPPTNPAFRAVVDAPLLLVLCARKGESGAINGQMSTKHGDWYMYDLGLATQNLCLTAHELGLGTVVVGWFDQAAVERVVNAPANIEVVSLIPVGYRKNEGVKPKHRPASGFVHQDRF